MSKLFYPGTVVTPISTIWGDGTYLCDVPISTIELGAVVNHTFIKKSIGIIISVINDDALVFVDGVIGYCTTASIKPL